MTILSKVTFFVDADGNTYRKASVSEAAGTDNAVRATVGKRANFYLPVDVKHLVTDAVNSFNEGDSEDSE